MAITSARIFWSSRVVFKDLSSKTVNSIYVARFHRHHHHVCGSSLNYLSNSSYDKRNRRYKVYSPTGLASVRWASLGVDGKPPIVFDEASLPPIPTPPGAALEQLDALPDVAAKTAEVLTEASLASYGLAGWTPVGLVQRGLEYVHVTMDIPWWGSIVIGTLVMRTLVFPLVILAQRNAAKMSNNLPVIQRLQVKMTEARQSGNNFEAARLAQELMVIMKDKKLNPITSMLPPLAQAPIFISMFMALRGMANVPVESFREGGFLWFVDLTVPDQYYLLPIITSATLAITIEVGTDSAKLSTLGMMRYVLRCLPIFIFPFTLNFPGAVLCYWVSTNFISLVQVGFLRIPAVRDYFKIEPLIIHPKDTSGTKKGFVKGFKESLSNMKITRQLHDRDNADYVNFQKAGRAPIQRTFKYDPTKPKPTTTNELLAKKK